jgi:peptidoglycan/LPS O-acetylase OafA/YrhL
MVRLSAEIIQGAPHFVNTLMERELDLRGTCDQRQRLLLLHSWSLCMLFFFFFFFFFFAASFQNGTPVPIKRRAGLVVDE